MKKSNDNKADKLMISTVGDNIPDFVEQARNDRNYHKFLDHPLNDLTLLHNQLAVFYPSDNQIYKLCCLDYRGGRFDVAGQKMTRFISFNHGITFNFTDIEQLNKYYALYSKNTVSPISKEEIVLWLSESPERISVGTHKRPK